MNDDEKVFYKAEAAHYGYLSQLPPNMNNELNPTLFR